MGAYLFPKVFYRDTNASAGNWDYPYVSTLHLV